MLRSLSFFKAAFAFWPALCAEGSGIKGLRSRAYPSKAMGVSFISRPLGVLERHSVRKDSQQLKPGITHSVQWTQTLLIAPLTGLIIRASLGTLGTSSWTPGSTRTMAQAPLCFGIDGVPCAAFFRPLLASGCRRISMMEHFYLFIL